MNDQPSSPFRIAFFGSGKFALASLQALLNGPDKIVLTVTTPSAKAGRGQVLTASPVALFAAERKIPFIETNAVNGNESMEMIERAHPEILVVVAFRGFLGQRLLSMGYTPPINVHPSLLPRHRGPAPISWTLIKGDPFCGVTVTFCDLKIDSGAILAQKHMPTPEGVSAGELETIFADIGADLLVKVMDQIRNDSLSPALQDESSATMNRLLTKADGLVDFERPAEELARLINGVNPWPGAQARFNQKIVKFYGAKSLPGAGRPGEILGLTDDGWLKIGTAQDLLAVEQVQPEGKAKIKSADFLRGYRGDSFQNGSL